MSETDARTYTSTVEIDLEVLGDGFQIRYCDTGASYWEGMEYIQIKQSDSDMIREIAASIRDEATDLARSLVADLRSRVSENSKKASICTLCGSKNDDLAVSSNGWTVACPDCIGSAR